MKKPLEKMNFKELKAEVRRMIRRGELTEKELIEFIRSTKASHPQKIVKIEEIQTLIDKEKISKDEKARE